MNSRGAGGLEDENKGRVKLSRGPAEVAQAFGIGPSLIRFPRASNDGSQSRNREQESKQYHHSLQLEHDIPSAPLKIPRPPSFSNPSLASSPSSFSSSSTIAPNGSPTPSNRTIRPILSKLTRPNSTIYESFPHRPPGTPFDSEESKEASGWLDWIGLGSHTHAVGFIQTREGIDLEGGMNQQSARGEEEPLLGCRKREGLPKVTRECLISEFKCYGKHMLPPIVFFVFFVLGVGLYVYDKARESQERP